MKLEIIKIYDDLGRTNKYIVIDKDNFRLPFAPINNFLESKRTRALNRLEDYTYGLINYFHWLNNNNLNYLDVSENQFIGYVSFLECEPDKRTTDYKLSQEYGNIVNINIKMKEPNTINKQIGIIRNFYEFLLKYSYVCYNPCPLQLTGKPGKGNVAMLAHTHNKERVIDALKVKKKSFFASDELMVNEDNEDLDPKEPFTAEEIKTIMELLTNPQDRLLICMLFLGMRVSEPLGRRINDIKWSQRIIQVIKRPDDPEDAKIKYDSERNVEMRNVLYFDNLIDVMKKSYDEYVHEILRPNKELNHRKYLFINVERDAKALRYSNIYARVIRDNLQKNISSRKITFHSFRHHFSTTNIALGRPIEEVQKALGHKDISTTIKDYYNPSLKFLKTLLVEKFITDREAESRAKHIIEYKKKFCK